MQPALLDINDCNLQLWHAGRHVQSPGYALLADGSYQFGTTALRAARLKPRDINTRFWWQLSTEALQPALGSARHSADLVHAHLNALQAEANNPSELVLSVPGSMHREQLSLLLGIIASCPFNAVGLVHRSTALASLFAPGEASAHLEIQLHQSLLSTFSVDSDHVELDRSTALPGVGLLQLQERLVEVAADAFLRQTRFDPRRQAATEQQLYDALPDALAALQHTAETSLDVNGYTAYIDRRSVEQIAQPLYDSVSKGLPAGVLLADPIAGLLPGLTNAFPGVRLLQADDIHRAVEAQTEQLVQRGEQLDFISRLPCLTAATDTHPTATVGNAAEPPAPTRQSARATHILQGSHATPLASAGTPLADGWSIERHGDCWQLRGTGALAQVNGASAQSGQVVDAGDAISIGAAEPVLLIQVQD